MLDYDGNLFLFSSRLVDSQDGELDAILKELCALGSQFEQELKDEDGPRSANTRSSGMCSVRFKCPLSRSLLTEILHSFLP